MKYKNTVEATFIERPNRFIAIVEIEGVSETVHVKNTGRCKELLIPGCKVVLEVSDNPSRKTKYDLICVYKEGIGWINIDSQVPNKVVHDWLLTRGYSYIKPEYTFGDSRVDFYMEKTNEACEKKACEKYLLEIKGCTLEREKIGYFPDAPTSRGRKHLRELERAASLGYNCSVGFVIQINDVCEVRPNTTTDPEFASALSAAFAAGVKVLFLCCKVTKDSIEIQKCIEADSI